MKAVSLTVDSGQFAAIIGATGSGKSTLVQHMNGILRPTKGTVRVLDMTIRPGLKQNMKEIRRRVGLVFQFPEQQLFEETVEKDLCFGPRNFGAGPEEAKLMAHQAMELMGLDPVLLGRSPFQLSGGQMRKVAIASVLAMDPDVLVLDEPTATLDPQSREDLMKLLHRLSTEKNKTVILVTHRLDELLELSDRIVVMHEGSVLFAGSKKEFFHQSLMLESKGIELPKSIRLFHNLERSFGVKLDPSGFSPEKAAETIASALGNISDR
ncbi:energy-coupling factor transporter ATPase [Paenibacillus larvae]|nr:energy-coupling factor transporter ATPase [Paenibacillus larvae]MDT2192781.1 energy-coupling factor transporter ATPase [Paenibacillus larvae]MDT2240068.1 energy-coupling factor transporter ATPase [Paenibacillus larvae]MDT2246702.1 energy-coupling factor transporter ATPase [Paenibacillus larvae]MDT2262992.1 energy-coupling factor transporter ATPase [Paenibacillus larvae]